MTDVNTPAAAEYSQTLVVEVTRELLNLVELGTTAMAEKVYRLGSSATVECWLKFTQPTDVPLDKLVELALESGGGGNSEYLRVTLRERFDADMDPHVIMEVCELIGGAGLPRHVETMKVTINTSFRDGKAKDFYYALAKGAAKAGDVRNLRLMKEFVQGADALSELYLHALKALKTRTCGVLVEWLEERGITMGQTHMVAALETDHPPTLQMYLETWGQNYDTATLQEIKPELIERGLKRSVLVLEEYLAARKATNDKVVEPA